MNLDIQSVLWKASGDLKEVAGDWMPTSRVRPFVVKDPGQIWLDKFGGIFGFFPDPISPYDYLEYQSFLDQDFRTNWRKKYARKCPEVCQEAYHVRYQYRLKKTLTLMADETTKVIYQPALWWAPDKIYGMPDFLVRTSWLKTKFIEAYQELVKVSGEPTLPDKFVLLEIRFSKSSCDPKQEAYKILHAQLRMQNYILSHLQGWAAPCAFLVNRIDVGKLNPFDVAYNLDSTLEIKLKEYITQYQDIINNGKDWKPWVNKKVELSARLEDGKWKTARKKCAWESREGGDPMVLHQIRKVSKQKLATAGFKTIDDLLKTEPTALPLEIAGIKAYAREIRAILQANRTNLPVVPTSPPTPKEFEFFVDFEYFSDLSMAADPFKNVSGEMIFMIGVGKNSPVGWVYKDFIAKRIGLDEELRILNEFVDYLRTETKGTHLDKTKTVIYHWSNAEITQTKKALGHHPQNLDMDFSKLPWNDLEKRFKEEGCAVPGVWNYGLKSVAKGLGKLDPKYDPKWIGDLDDGSGVIVLGAIAYQEKKDIEKTDEMKILRDYLQADCRALSCVLNWMRSGEPGTKFGDAGLAYIGWEKVKKAYHEPKSRQAFAGLNNGKGVVVYLHPGSPNKQGEPTGIKALNHLIWGDWLEILDEQEGWYRVHSRNTRGWMHKSWVHDDRLLEINFVDVGQGDGCLVITPDDEKLLIDAGEADNMYRFLRWRFGRFQKPVVFNAMIITHPDQDHYAGFDPFFKKEQETKNIYFKTIYHNGIIEATKKKDAAAHMDVVAHIAQTRADLHNYLKEQSRSNYLKLLREAEDSGRVNDIRMINATPQAIQYLPGFEKGKKVEIEVLGPILETISGTGYLRWFKDVGKTKNGHSVVLRLIIGEARILLGGDLNEVSEELLLTNYANLVTKTQMPEDDTRIEPARTYLEVEVAKSCHHGSADLSPAFMRAVNALATVVSSGDEEPHCHPRPETLGIIGKFGRGQWPLIFSTELARSTRETVQHPFILRKKLNDARKEDMETEFIDDLMGQLDRSVAVYGMITLRTDGEKILMAQKLEQPRSASQKWDLHLIQLENGEWSYHPNDK